MKIPALFVLVSMLLGGCSKPDSPTEAATRSAPSPPPEYPILVIDQDHQLHSTNDLAYEISARIGVGINATNFHFAHGTNMAPAYQISAAPGIQIDATKFQFRDGTNPFNPNMVQLFGNESLYRLSRETETNFYTVDYYKLETVGGEPFRGFNRGDHITVALGRSTNTFHSEEFWIMWLGHIEVK